MKRYWKIITLCIITVIGIGIFYIQSSLAGNDDIQIEFERVSGNEDEVENLSLYASYEFDYMYQTLQISSKGTFNLENQSPLQQLIREKTVPVFKELIEKHRSFMRSKELLPSYFYEDESLLVYANISRDVFYESRRNSSFDIEVLNKKSGETTSIQLDKPKDKNNSWTDVVEVQVIDGKLKVFTREQVADEVGLYVYTFDIEGQKLIDNELIVSKPTVENGWSDVRIINHFYSIQPEKYLLIKLDAYEDRDMQGEGEVAEHSDAGPDVVTNEVSIYNLEDNQLEIFITPDDLSGDIDSSAIYDSTIFIPSQSASGLEVNQYDIEKRKWGKKLTFDLLPAKSGEDTPFVQLMNGKVYIIRSIKNGHSLFIGDLKTGESLYEGKLKVKNPGPEQKDYRLYINEIEDV
ncbi:hypothetical protein [Bacillus sp. FSL K6-3431]|uniref:hypothetical protein n=1 Tax=Bacillus sp. FSL K6-3431 TaxID=2921500 RepID=UPI0030FAC935